MNDSMTSRTRGALAQARRGMTLVEILVVVAIIAGMMGGGIYYLGVMTNSTLRNESMRLTSSIKYTWTQAAMNNAQYRMVFDLDEERYWTEITRSPVAPDEEDEPDESGETEDERNQRFVSEEARKLEEREGESSRYDSEDDQSPFNTRRKLTYKKVQDAKLKPRTLSDGIGFQSVIKGGEQSARKEGRAAVRFFPNGFQEPAMIKLVHESGAVFTLVTEPLTGRVHVFNRDLEPREGFGEPVRTED